MQHVTIWRDFADRCYDKEVGFGCRGHTGRDTAASSSSTMQDCVALCDTVNERGRVCGNGSWSKDCALAIKAALDFV